MTPNFILLSVLTAGVVVVLIFLIKLIHKLTLVADQVETAVKNLNDLSPRIQSVLDHAEQELVTINSITARLDHMVGRVEQVGTAMVSAATPVVDLVSGLSRPFQFLRAAMNGVSTGLSFLRRARGKGNGDVEDEYMEANFGRRTRL